MNKKTRVLIFPCGSVMAAEIYQALRYSAHVELFGASSVDDYGRFLFERYTGGLPYISDNEFDEAFAAVIKRLNIEMVFAPHDSIINHLAPKAQAMGFFLVNGDPTTAAIVRKKSATYSLFSDCDWTPETYKSLPEVQDWPIIIKPDIGQGGCDVFLVRNLNEASLAVGRIANPVFLEYLPGGEVTVDCFSDRNRKLIWVGPRSRVRVRGGVAMRTNTLELSREIEFIASEINSRLNLRGPWYFQLKAGLKGKWKLLEIACRIGGATAAQRARGINLPLMAVQDYLGRDLIVAHNPQVNCIERNISSRATLDFDFDTIFIDLDGALIINGFAVPQVLFFYLNLLL